MGANISSAGYVDPCSSPDAESLYSIRRASAKSHQTAAPLIQSGRAMRKLETMVMGSRHEWRRSIWWQGFEAIVRNARREVMHVMITDTPVNYRKTFGDG